MLSAGSLLALLLFIALLIEWLTERFFGAISKLKGYPMILLSAAIGVALCFGLDIDALSLVGFTQDYPHWLGVLITGIVAGSGSNAVHAFFSRQRKA